MDSFLEIKSLLSGGKQQFTCDLVDCDRQQLVLHYLLDRERQLDDQVLAAETQTFAYYWNDKPFNAYHFVQADGQTLAFYFNISDRTEWNENRLSWRDLVVDVLIIPPRPAKIIDREELPQHLSRELEMYIESALDQVLHNQSQLTQFLREQTNAWMQHRNNQSQIKRS